MPWYTLTDDFDADFDVDEWHGTNAFIRDDDLVFRTYFFNNRGDEALGSTWSYLDMTALRRQEEWEDSPEGYPRTPPYAWWNWHDEYGDAEPSQGWLAQVAGAPTTERGGARSRGMIQERGPATAGGNDTAALGLVAPGSAAWESRSSQLGRCGERGRGSASRS